MDLMSLLMDGIASETSIKTIGKKSNSSPDQVSTILMSAVPMLISQMQKNAESETGASKLSNALDAHAKDDVSNIADFLKNADTEDGAKILNHIMGSKRNRKSRKESGCKNGFKNDPSCRHSSTYRTLAFELFRKRKADYTVYKTPEER